MRRRMLGVGVAMEPGELLVPTNDTALHGAAAGRGERSTDCSAQLHDAARGRAHLREGAWKGRRFIIDKRAFFDFDTIAGTAREMASCQQAGWPDARAGFKRLAVAAACIARGHVAKADSDRQKYGHLHAGEDKR